MINHHSFQFAWSDVQCSVNGWRCWTKSNWELWGGILIRLTDSVRLELKFKFRNTWQSFQILIVFWVYQLICFVCVWACRFLLHFNFTIEAKLCIQHTYWTVFKYNLIVIRSISRCNLEEWIRSLYAQLTYVYSIWRKTNFIFQFLLVSN